jgi:nicotinate dehydrogenase subunit A
MTLALKVNGKSHDVEAEPDTPLIYVLRNDLALNSPRFGCGLAQCGSCTVLIDGKPALSCVTAAGRAAGADIVTLEGLGSPDRLHPLKQAFIAEQAAQCGYCTPGIIMRALDLLTRNPHPSEQDVREALAGNLCRCGAHNRIIRAVLRAARMMGKGP